MIDPAPLWNFDDPAASEVRFREAALAASEERDAWLTQVARALGLQKRYEEGLVVLEPLDEADPEVACRVALERGRLVRSSGDPVTARPHFEEAARVAFTAGLEELHLDALHMLALCAEPEDQVRAHERAIEVARAATDPRARDWDASLLNNLGMVHAEAGDHAAALTAFTEALEARERIGEVDRIRVARWMVAWSLRHLGRHEEALALQRALRNELAVDGLTDTYVEDEIALLEG